MSQPAAFRSNGLLSFGPSSSTLGVNGLGERPRGSLRMDSPPPDLEEEPEDYEMNLEAEMEGLRERETVAELKSIRETLKSPIRETAAETSFKPNGLLSFGRSSMNIGRPQEPESIEKVSEAVNVIETPSFRYINESTTRIFEPPGLPLNAVTSGGATITFQRRPRRRIDLSSPLVKTGPDKELLSVPMHRLLQEVEEEKSRLAAVQMQTVFDIENDEEDPSKVAGPSRDRAMWVDKYRPKRYADLLGEDRVHREVLGWLKEWDKCVFKRAAPTSKKRARKDDDDSYEYYDALGRPKERILLLSGPPGFGKTTLAHIVTAHAGYHPLEVNASDDRSAATISTRVKNAIEAGSGFGSKGKPTCVVLDEIDGATGGGDQSFIRTLIKLIQDVPARKKTNTPAKPLRRPIICICNDLYAPALRPLRQFARIIRFKKPSPLLIVKRLRDICEREVMDADTRALTTLVEVTGGDVRTCLNTLQFIKSKTTSVTEAAVKSATVGSKDAGTTLNAMWNALFVPVATKQRRKAVGIEYGKYVNRLAFQVQACGDYDKVVMGCFEHYPNLKPIDGSLGNISRMHTWLGFYDQISTLVNEKQEYELMAYMAYAVVPWHSCFASPANSARPAEWPKADYECFVTRTANMETVTALTATIPPAVRSLYTATTVLTELAPLLMRIISPPLKPVNAGIVKPEERITLVRLVEIMIHLGLRFYQEKQEDGQPQMRLEPAIDVFIHYDGKRAVDIAASRYAVRTLVAQAIDSEIARRRGANAAAGEARQAGAGLFKAKLKNGKPGDKVDIADLPATDFFGRLLTASSAIAENAPSIRVDDVIVETFFPPVKKFRAVYRFNEGSSAAVRKPVKMQALM